MKKILFVGAIILVAVNCAGQSGKSNDQKKESEKNNIEALHQKAVSALNRGDLKDLMSVYTDDVISMPEGQNNLVGKEAVLLMWKELLENYQVHVTVITEEVESCNALAFERGSFEMTLNPKAGGQATTNKGKYLDILRRHSDGTWKFFRVSFSSNKPSGL